MSKFRSSKVAIILNNIRSNENVGSIFRTADAVGVSKIILVGYTPAPVDRFGRENKGLTKASLGAEKFVKWGKAESLKEAIKKLKKENFVIIGIEQDKNAVDYREINKLIFSSTKSAKADHRISGLALIFGNEVEGLSKEDLKFCDIVAELPMRGRKESLNVAVCAGVVLYSLITD